MSMNRRRFMFLAIALVALNSFFWVAQGGFALPSAIINQLFGSQMIRAEVLVQTPTGAVDYRVDQGVIKTIAPGSLVIREKNGDMVTIQLSGTATVTGPGGRILSTSLLRRGMRVIAVAPANAPAESIQVQGFGP